MEAFRDIGYYWDDQMILREVESNERFSGGNVSNRIVPLISPYVQHLLKTQYNMQEIWIPAGHTPQSNIFLSADWYENSNKALLLIQGAGEVRAGIWSRSVCMKISLYHGSMLPFLDYAQQKGFSVIIFNPNYVRDPLTGGPIPQLNSPIKHSSHVWEEFVRASPARELFIVGHSCGGVVSYELIHLYQEEFRARVRAIALTDSVHFRTQESNQLFRSLAVNWKASNKPLDTLIAKAEDANNDCTNVSAGHPEHAYTTPYALNSILAFIEGKDYINS